MVFREIFSYIFQKTRNKYVALSKLLLQNKKIKRLHHFAGSKHCVLFIFKDFFISKSQWPPCALFLVFKYPNVHLSDGQISHGQISFCANLRVLFSDVHFALAQISGHHSIKAKRPRIAQRNWRLSLACIRFDWWKEGEGRENKKSGKEIV